METPSQRPTTLQRAAHMLWLWGPPTVMAHHYEAAHFRGLPGEVKNTHRASTGVPAKTNPKDHKLLREQLQAKRLPGMRDEW